MVLFVGFVFGILMFFGVSIFSSCYVKAFLLRALLIVFLGLSKVWLGGCVFWGFCGCDVYGSVCYVSLISVCRRFFFSELSVSDFGCFFFWLYGGVKRLLVVGVDWWSFWYGVVFLVFVYVLFCSKNREMVI